MLLQGTTNLEILRSRTASNFNDLKKLACDRAGNTIIFTFCSIVDGSGVYVCVWGGAKSHERGGFSFMSSI